MAAERGLTPKQAVARQRELCARVVRRGRVAPPATVAGVDVGVRDGIARAAVVVLAFPELALIERASSEQPVDFPYVPGLLGFREVPAILRAFEKLSRRPDLLLVDGHGLAHPRRFGVACHLGVELDLAAIGCGKSRLIGMFREPGPRRGAGSPLVDRGETIGHVLRTRAGVKPLFVSIGHRIDLPRAVELVLACTPRFRLPEPIRAADAFAARRTADSLAAPARMA
jgi:deoxyribonuclease V